ncbi:Fur family transcriptional regulator [Nitrosomonas ureae]|uniref:Fur family transcriptional regulator, zinc uptake regulator n=2 Tax=Nitrosomonas ureae TaxID=44577 RepID=A0A1H9D4E4_9PROT|nr:Fur family transcriptional regulator [Nitrosomonas ureae]PTQ82900.1 Fur family zinc uptake transcriptional regulator [Nitrosomonas ureae]PXX11664.1 Fur family zinc uptake transcriptional regulator [Nitrosomonas ureae]SEQ08314.1 Fur family transcriptional regulator, zinc uptake regulator [Nitrosomonas ureae]
MLNFIKMSANIEQIIKKSQEVCASAGAKLTHKRKNVLMVLLASATPLSAYEVVDKYKTQFQESLPVMSVYRMLDFLVQEKLVHKLETAGQYMSCAHIACDHQHETPQFLICDRCGSVKEVGIKKRIIEELEHSIQNTGFTLAHKQLELHGVCKFCQDHST